MIKNTSEGKKADTFPGEENAGLLYSASFDIDDPAFRPFEAVRESFTDEGENIFLIKTNYWLGV